MSLARNVLLAASSSAWLRERATKAPFVRRAVSRFMPGERLEDAMLAARRQQTQGIATIFTHLGENLTRIDEADQVTEHYLDVLEKVNAAGVDAQISVKPTQLGLDLDKELCYRNLQRLVDRAAGRGNFVWIDMESSPCVDPTLELFRRTRAVVANRHRASGISVSHVAGCRVAAAARFGDPSRQRRVSRVAGHRVPKEVRRRRELLQAGVPSPA